MREVVPLSVPWKGESRSVLSTSERVGREDRVERITASASLRRSRISGFSSGRSSAGLPFQFRRRLVGLAITDRPAENGGLRSYDPSPQWIIARNSQSQARGSKTLCALLEPLEGFLEAAGTEKDRADARSLAGHPPRGPLGKPRIKPGRSGTASAARLHAKATRTAAVESSIGLNRSSIPAHAAR